MIRRLEQAKIMCGMSTLMTALCGFVSLSMGWRFDQRDAAIAALIGAIIGLTVESPPAMV